jgi:Outer membrane protein beta-barrel domain
MNKKLSLVVVILTALALTGSALALAPMGPPTAGLKTGQFRAGVDYSYSSTDWKVDFDGDTVKVKHVKSNLFVADLGYGIMDDWEASVLLGTSDIRGDYAGLSASGKYGFAWGFGTKYTFLKQDNLNWGVLYQMDWQHSRDNDATGGLDVKATPYEIQLAVGPTYKLNDTLAIYGGPFLHYIGGNLEIEGSSAKLRESGVFGGYVGLEAQLCENTSMIGEFQLVDGAWGLATGVNWKF